MVKPSQPQPSSFLLLQLRAKLSVSWILLTVLSVCASPFFFAFYGAEAPHSHTNPVSGCQSWFCVVISSPQAFPSDHRELLSRLEGSVELGVCRSSALPSREAALHLESVYRCAGCHACDSQWQGPWVAQHMGGDAPFLMVVLFWVASWALIQSFRIPILPFLSGLPLKKNF